MFNHPNKNFQISEKSIKLIKYNRTQARKNLSPRHKTDKQTKDEKMSLIT